MSRSQTEGKVGGIHTYYQSKIDSLEIAVQDKATDIKRLEARRNELNAAGMSAYVFFAWNVRLSGFLATQKRILRC